MEPKMIDGNLPKLLKSLRAAHDLTHDEIARYLLLNRSTDTNYELGKTISSTFTMLALSAYYHIPFLIFAHRAVGEPFPFKENGDIPQKAFGLAGYHPVSSFDG